jgi:hypothetical protein
MSYNNCTLHFLLGATAPSGAGTPHSLGFYITHNDASQLVRLLRTSDKLVTETSTWQHTTLTTDRHPCPPLGFEPTISKDERPHTYALPRAATGTVILCISNYNIAITNNNWGRLQHLILPFRISTSTRKNMLPTYRKFGHAPSKSFASPDAVNGLWTNVFRFREVKVFFAAASIPAVRPTQPPTKWRSFSRWGGGRELTGRDSLEADHSAHLFHVLRMNEATSPFRYVPRWHAHG